jgi:hypothetical protein
MKKMFPIAIIALTSLTALVVTSCTKKNSGTSTCTCTYKGGVTGGDTTIKYTAPVGYSSLSDYCNAENTAVKTIDPTGSCHL